MTKNNEYEYLIVLCEFVFTYVEILFMKKILVFSRKFCIY